MIIRIVVDLPDPFGPRKPVTVPGVTSKVSELTAASRPYRFVRDLTAIIGSPCGTRLRAIGRSRYEHRGRRGIRLPAAFLRGDSPTYGHSGPVISGASNRALTDSPSWMRRIASASAGASEMTFSFGLRLLSGIGPVL